MNEKIASRFSVALTSGLLLATLATVPALAGEDGKVVRRQVKIVLDGDAAAAEVSDLEPGESRVIYTESGKQVVLTRGEDGLEVEVDGERIDIDIPHGDHMTWVSGDCEGDCEDVFVHRIHGGDAKAFAFIAQDGEAVGERIHLRTKGRGAVEHLRQKGLLDELDPEMREKIVEALEELEDSHRVILLDIDEEKRHHHHDN